jgi:palmitoyltransferase
MISCQLFLYQYLYYVVKVDSIFEIENDNELQNINEKHDYTTCKKCNIMRPKRAHHCRYCNKCILQMDHHCFTLNKCIGKNNYPYFLKYLIFAQLNSSHIFWITIYVSYNYYSEFKLVSFIKYGILIFASLMGSCGLFFYLLFHLYLNLTNLTTLEYIYPTLRINKINRIDS